MARERTVFFVSDRTGITVETLGNMLLTQFEDTTFRRVSLPFIDTPERAREAVARINAAARDDGVRPLVFSTLVQPAVRDAVAGCLGLFLDFFDPFIGAIERELEKAPSRAVGRSHGLGDSSRYDVRMDAVNYTLSTDDGLSAQAYRQADIILLGVSRSGKTPTCLYLALQFGLRAANYPLTEEDLGGNRLPAALQPFRPVLYGLTIDPLRLQAIRQARRPGGGRYSSPAQCRFEVERAEALYRAEGVPYLNTTSLSVEEISATILLQRQLERRLY